MKHPRFTIFKSEKDGQYYFNLRAKNGRIIFNSKGEGYTQKHNALECIEVVRAGNWEPFIIQAMNGDWCWVAKANNGEIVGSNETYTTKAGAEKGISSVQRCAVAAVIVDKTKD